MFSCEFCKIYKNKFYTEHLWPTASEYTLTFHLSRGGKVSYHTVGKFESIEMLPECQIGQGVQEGTK